MSMSSFPFPPMKIKYFKNPQFSLVEMGRNSYSYSHHTFLRTGLREETQLWEPGLSCYWMPTYFNEIFRFWFYKSTYLIFFFRLIFLFHISFIFIWQPVIPKGDEKARQKSLCSLLIGSGRHRWGEGGRASNSASLIFFLYFELRSCELFYSKLFYINNKNTYCHKWIWLIIILS